MTDTYFESANAISSRCTALRKIAPEEPAIPMYSYMTPAWTFWDFFIEALMAQHKSEEEIIRILQSKEIRKAFDDSQDKFKKLARNIAKQFV